MATKIITTAHTTVAAAIADLITNTAFTVDANNSDLIHCGDNIEVQGNFPIHGKIFSFASGKSIWTNGGTIVAGRKRNGIIDASAHIIFNGRTGYDENTGVDNVSQSLVRGTSGGWAFYGGSISVSGSTGGSGINFVQATTSTGTVILDDVSFSHNRPLGGSNTSPVVNFTFRLRPGSSCVAREVIQAGIRVLSTDTSFSFSGKGAGFFMGQRGADVVKLLSVSNEYEGFYPSYLTADGYMQTSGANYESSDISFKNSGVVIEKLAGHGSNMATVTRRIKRDFEFKPATQTGSAINGFDVQIRANRRVQGTTGNTAGNVVLHTLTNKNSGDAQVVQVIHATNAGVAITGDSAYRFFTNITFDNDVTVECRKYGYEVATFSDTSQTEKATAIFGMVEDANILERDGAVVAAYTDTNPVRRMYDATNYIIQNMFNIAKSNFILTGSDADGWTFDLGSYDITIDANAASGLPVINGNRITFKANTVSGKLKTTGTITLSNGSTIPDGYEDATQDSEVEIIGVDISGNNTLWYSLATTAPTVETDTGWTQMATTKYKYKATDASDTSTVHFRLKKPDTDGTGAHYSKDDWRLNQKGLGLRFEKFTSEFGVVADGLKRDLLAQMTTDKNSLDAQFANNGQTLQRMENTGNTTLQMTQGIAGRAHLEYSSTIELTGTGLIETQGFVGKYKKLDVVKIKENFFSSLYNPIAGGRNIQPTVDPTRGCWVKEAANEADNIYIWYSVNQGGVMVTKKLGDVNSYLLMEVVPTGGEPGNYPYLPVNEVKLRRPGLSFTTDNVFVDVPTAQYTYKMEGLEERYLLEDNATISEVAKVVQKDALRVPEVLEVPDDPATI